MPVRHTTNLNRLIGIKKPLFWYSIDILKTELNNIIQFYFNLIANNGPINPGLNQKLIILIILLITMMFSSIF